MKNELLTPSKPARPIDKAALANDAATLNGLVGMLNNPALTGAVVEKPVPLPEDFETSVPAAPLIEEPVEQTQTESTKRLFFTGSLKSGKDHAAALAGCKIYGFADPVYQVASHLFETEITSLTGKDIPGVRSALQIIGQWGRGMVSERYPLTLERARFAHWVRRDGAKLFGSRFQVNWSQFGKTESLWVDALIQRVADEPAEARIGVTNCRFMNEFKSLQAAGYTHWHIMCSPKTLNARLDGKTAVLKDTSEQFALRLNQNVIEQISKQRNGKRLHCVWSDTEPSPSPRLHSVESFLKIINS